MTFFFDWRSLPEANMYEEAQLEQVDVTKKKLIDGLVLCTCKYPPEVREET